MRGGQPPLDFETVSARAVETECDGQTVGVASLRSLVGSSAWRADPKDRVDLAELEAIHGFELPVKAIPGLDD